MLIMLLARIMSSACTLSPLGEAGSRQVALVILISAYFSHVLIGEGWFKMISAAWRGDLCAPAYSPRAWTAFFVTVCLSACLSFCLPHCLDSLGNSVCQYNIFAYLGCVQRPVATYLPLYFGLAREEPEDSNLLNTVLYVQINYMYTLEQLNVKI